MTKKTPKYNDAKEIVEAIDFAIVHANAAHDNLMIARLEFIRKRVIAFDNSLWEQSEEMSKYLSV